jgi:hypothetical protein
VAYALFDANGRILGYGPGEEPDARWFARFPQRLTRIRSPGPGEAATEFATLGPHNTDRRRVLILRMPDGPFKGKLMPIPFLLFGDETVENEDAVLLPIIREIMGDAAKDYGVSVPKVRVQ